CIALYEEFKQNPDGFFFPQDLLAIAGSITQASDYDMPALQAADFLAGQMISNLKRGIVPEPLKLMASRKKIAHFASFPPNFEKMGDMVSSLDSLLALKKQLAEQKRRLIHEGKWEFEEAREEPETGGGT